MSHDIARANVQRRLGVSSFSMTLSNRGRKYDGIFSPMDRVAIYLRRIGPPLLVMTGYLDSVPAFSTHSKAVSLRGSCTLKRLQHWYWDPTSPKGAELMSRFDDSEAVRSVTDGGVSGRIVEVLTEVGQWNKNNIHIAAVPGKWFEDLAGISADLIAEAERLQTMASLGAMSHLGGEQNIVGLARLPGIGKGTGELPGQVHTVSVFGGPGGRSGTMNLTGEPMRTDDNDRAQWGGPYYVAARWPYRSALTGMVAEGVDRKEAEGWWRNRKILVLNPKTNQGVVVRAAHWGPPAGSAASMNLSRSAFDALGATPGTGMHVAFAPEDATLGPISGGNSAVVSSGNDPVVAQTVQDMADYGRPPRQIGSTFAQLEALLTWADERGYRVREHPQYGGVTPGFHMSVAEGGFHWWPQGNPPGGAAADITWPSGGTQVQNRKLDELAAEVCRRGLGCIWRSHGHWGHVHVDISLNRRMGTLVYASLDGNVIPTPLGSPGNMGTGYAPGAQSGSPEQLGTALFGAFQYIKEYNTTLAGEVLGGPRALMNDVPLYSTVNDLMNSALRDWCSAPNGDIIGWFPDYFGRFGTAAKMIVEDIEIDAEGFAADWSDDRLKTHVFVTGSWGTVGGYLQPMSGGASDVTQMSMTAGIASVEFPELMKVLFDLDPAEFADHGQGFMRRFGARPENISMNNIVGPHAEFFFSVFKFMQNWSNQYSATIATTFLPEMYPGMLAVFPRYGVQAYVRGVTHNIDMGSGGFTTSLELTAWSRIGNSDAAIRGLPKGGDL